MLVLTVEKISGFFLAKSIVIQWTWSKAAWRKVALVDATWLNNSSASCGRDFKTWEFLNSIASSSDAAFSNTCFDSLLALISL